MSRTENVELTVVCLLEDGDKILLQDRVKTDWHGYALPGGHVEKDESFLDAVKREMKEETGLEIRNPRLVGLKQFPIDNGRYLVVLFKATEWSGELTSSEEGKMEWVEYARLAGAGHRGGPGRNAENDEFSGPDGAPVCAKWGQLDRRHSIKDHKKQEPSYKRRLLLLF